MNRRTWIAAAVAALAGPGVALAGMERQSRLVLWGDGEHDDSDALQGLIDGRAVYRPSGERVAYMQNGALWLPGRTPTP